MKNIIILLCILLSSSLKAQSLNSFSETIKIFNDEKSTQTCDSLMINYRINQPKLIKNYTSVQIQKIFNRREEYLLGLHVGKREYALSIEKKDNGCHHFSLNIIFNADIYLANETLHQKCTYLRTRDHEFQHFIFEVDEIKKKNEWILNILKYNKTSYQIDNPPYKKSYYDQSVIEIESGFAIRNKKKHESIDTKENYFKEQLSCPEHETSDFIETVSFNKLFRN